MKTLSAYSGSRDNNFNLLRFIAALSVVVTHTAVVVNGPEAVEPLMVETGYTLGHHAVNVFFVISGFLVARSLMHSTDFFDYIAARTARLLPGLFAAAAVTAFVIGPFMTEGALSAYFTDWHVFAYVPVTGAMIADNLQLPGVFASAPSPNELNAPLWTLRWEAFAYAGLAVAGALGLMASRFRFTIAVGGFLAIYIAITGFTELRDTVALAEHPMRLGLCFLVGAAFYMYRDSIPVTFKVSVPLWAIVVLLRNSFAYELALVLAMAHTVFWLAYVPGGVIRRFNELGDASYGIYIYGFPIQQMAVLALPWLTPTQSFFVVVPFVLSAAFLSFYLIEKPALAHRRRLADLMRMPYHWLTSVPETDTVKEPRHS